MKNLKKLSVKSGIAIFSLAFFLLSCGKAPEHVKYIPKEANVVVAVDVKSMALKSLDFKNFFNIDALLNKKSDKKDSLAQKIKESGIDLLTPAYIFAQVEENGYGAGLFAISDAAKFETFVKSLDNSVTVNASGELKTATLQNNEELLIGWNSKAAIFIGMDNGSPEKLKEKLTTLFNTTSEGSLSEQDKNFQALLKETGDISLWVNFEKMSKFASMLNDNAGKVNLKETYLHAKMNFEKGEVTVDTKYFANKEMGDKFAGMSRDNVSEDVVNSLPGKSVIALFGVGVDLNKLYDYLEKENLLADFNENMKQTTGMQGKEVFQIFSGDIAATVNGLKSIMAPEFAISLGVSDKEKLGKLLTALTEKQMLQKADNYYTLPMPGYFVAEKDKNFIIGPESMRQQLMDGSGDKLNGDLKSLLTSNASVFYLSIAEIPDEILSMPGAKFKDNIRKSTLESITLTGSSQKDNISTGKLVVSFKNKDENSLVTLSKISQELAAQQAAEPVMEEIPYPAVQDSSNVEYVEPAPVEEETGG